MQTLSLSLEAPDIIHRRIAQTTPERGEFDWRETVLK
jgi:hypothetical protein